MFIVVPILLILTLIVIFILLPAYRLKRSADKFIGDVTIMKADYQQKNLIAMAAEVPVAQNDLSAIHQNLHAFSFVHVLPIVSGYYANADHALNAGDDMFLAFNPLVSGILPFADLAGFKNSTTQSQVSTAQKMQVIVKALPSLEPSILKAQPYIIDATNQLKMIDPKYMPKEYKGIKIDRQLQNAITLLNDVNSLIPQIQTIVPILSNAMGLTTPKNYLILFQNDKELRPTGGFITAYGFLSFNNGKMGKIQTYNIYDMDKYFKKQVTPPIALQRYNAATTWAMRDANLSPDVPTSVQDIYWFYNQTPTMPHVDGVVFVDTQVVSDLLTVTGPLKVQGYNQTVNASNVAYEMEYYAEKLERDKPDSVRKAFVSAVDETLMSNIMSANKDEWMPLIQTALDALNKKDISLYANDTATESYIVSKNWGDTVVKNPQGDYLDIVEANLGGAKANFYIKRKITDSITKLANGDYQVNLTIHYSNNQKYDDWLSAPYKAWLRVYVPYGSTLQSITGVDGVLEVHNDTDLNKTYFDDHIRVPVKYNDSDPPATLDVKVSYIVPGSVNPTDTYNLLVQKEAGMHTNEYDISYNGKIVDQIIDTDKEFTL